MNRVFHVRRFGVFLASSLLAVASPGFGANLLTNPSLETDSSPADSWPDGNWKLQNANPSALEKAQWVSESASGFDSNHTTGGNRGIRVKSNWAWNGSSAVLTQEKNLTYDVTSLVTANGFDKDYTFSVWLRGTIGGSVQTDSSGTQLFKNGTTYVVLAYNLNGSTIVTQAPAETATAAMGTRNIAWENLGALVNIPSGATGIQLKFGLTPNSQGEVYVDDANFDLAATGVTFKDGVLRIDGAPYQVNGFFMGGDQCLNDVGRSDSPNAGACDTANGFHWSSERIKNAGYNTVISYPNGGSNATAGTFIDRCNSLGLKVIISLKDFVKSNTPVTDSTLTTLVNMAKAKPNVIGWYTGDELPDSSVGSGSLFRQYYTYLKGTDTQDRPIIGLMTNVTPNNYSGNPVTQDPSLLLPGCDIIMADPYPVGIRDRGRGESIAMTFRWTNTLRSAVDTYNAGQTSDNKRQVWMAPQAFAWGDGPFSSGSADEAPPTLREARNMAYQCLAGGANGTLYWSFAPISDETQWSYLDQEQVERDPNQLATVGGFQCWPTYIDSYGNPAHSEANKMHTIVRTNAFYHDPVTGVDTYYTNLGRRMSDMALIGPELSSLAGIVNGITSEEGIQELGGGGKVKVRKVTSGGDLYLFVANAQNLASGSITIALPNPILTSPTRTVSVVKQDVDWLGAPLTSGATGFINPSLAANKLSVTVSNINPWGSFVLKVTPR